MCLVKLYERLPNGDLRFHHEAMYDPATTTISEVGLPGFNVHYPFDGAAHPANAVLEKVGIGAGQDVVVAISPKEHSGDDTDDDDTYDDNTYDDDDDNDADDTDYDNDGEEDDDDDDDEYDDDDDDDDDDEWEMVTPELKRQRRAAMKEEMGKAYTDMKLGQGAYAAGETL